MDIFRDLSLLWSLIHILILFIFFYEPRFSRKKTLILTCIFMGPLGLLNIAGVIIYGPQLMGQLIMLTCTVPSGIFFFTVAKNRNWKFLFTFSVVDTISYEIIVITRLLDFLIGGDKCILMFVLRLMAFPIMEWVAYKYLRKPYLELQRVVKRGWAIFTLVSLIYYVLLLLMANFPTMIIYRPRYIPAMAVMLVLMPINYIGMFITLRGQMKLQDSERREQLLKLQTVALEQRIEQNSVLEEEMKIQRHDMRHRYSVLREMLSSGKNEKALEYIAESDGVLQEMKRKKYCTDPIIDAVFGYFIRKAEEHSIAVEVSLAVPDDLGLHSTELSVVFANVLENAIHANLQLPEERRFIKCRSVNKPQFMFQITNPFVGKIHFDETGRPVSDKPGHGTGIRSIVAFCEKNDVYSEFKIEEGCFIFRMAK